MRTNSAIATVAALQDSAVIAVLHKSCNLPTPLLVRWLDFVFCQNPRYMQEALPPSRNDFVWPGN